MCDFKSMIVTIDGDVHYSIRHDSHDQLLEELKFKDDTADTELMKFARVEIVPPDGDIFEQDLNKWIFKIDQSITPKWWGKDLEDKCFVQLKKALTAQVFIGQSDVELKDGMVFLKNSVVRGMHDNSAVQHMCDNSVVHHMRDNSVVRCMHDNSVVHHMRDNSVVHTLQNFGQYSKNGNIYVLDKKIVKQHTQIKGD